MDLLTKKIRATGWGEGGGGIKIQTSDSDYSQNYNFILKILRSES